MEESVAAMEREEQQADSLLKVIENQYDRFEESKKKRESERERMRAERELARKRVKDGALARLTAKKNQIQ